MKVDFVRSARVALGPIERAEAERARAWPVRLTHADVPRAGPDREIVLAVRAKDGALLGRLSIEDADWPARVARLVARWGDADLALATEAVALVALYARRDLNLRLEAAPAEPAWADVLRGAGLAQDSDGAWSTERALVPP